LLRDVEGVAFAKDISADFEVVVAELDAAGVAGEAVGVELLPGVGLEILAFDAAVAAFAKRVVELVVVLLAVGKVVDNVEVGGLERGAAGLAHKAW
jgi:hypothetical protein